MMAAVRFGIRRRLGRQQIERREERVSGQSRSDRRNEKTERPCAQGEGRRRCSRREWVCQATLGAAALAALPDRSLHAGKTIADSAQVFVVHHKDVCPVVDEWRPADPKIVHLMVKEAMLRMFGGKSVADIVASWCPSGKTRAAARVKIKYNGTRGRFPSHAEVVNGVVRLLVADGGINPENIHVYENCPKNFGEQDRPPFFGTPFAGGKNREPGVVYSHLNAPDGTDMAHSNYREEVRLDLGDGQFKAYPFWFWEALDKDTDILINVASLKRHITSATFPAVTLSMKNHYGSIRDPYRHHGREISEKIAAVNLAKPIRQKQKLIVIDALYAMYNQGPERGRMRYGINKVLVARDPVAADYVGWGMLDEVLRQESAKDPAWSGPKECPEPREIAIGARNGLGVRADTWQSHVVELNLASRS